MINGTMKCTILDKVVFDPVAHNSAYCARFDVLVLGYTDGQKTETNIQVYFPEFMRKRMDYFLRPETKYCVIVFDTISVVVSPTNANVPVIAMRANRIEA